MTIGTAFAVYSIRGQFQCQTGRYLKSFMEIISMSEKKCGSKKSAAPKTEKPAEKTNDEKKQAPKK